MASKYTRRQRNRRSTYESRAYKEIQAYISRKYLGPLMAETLLGQMNRVGFARRLLDPNWKAKEIPKATPVRDELNAILEELGSYNRNFNYTPLIPWYKLLVPKQTTYNQNAKLLALAFN